MPRVAEAKKREARGPARWGGGCASCAMASVFFFLLDLPTNARQRECVYVACEQEREGAIARAAAMPVGGGDRSRPAAAHRRRAAYERLARGRERRSA